MRYDALRLHGPGTDLTIGLFPSAHWAAGDLETVDGRRHSPNLPTEELFGPPDPERVDGHVSATMPLELSGSIISGIRVEFEGGRAVKIDADAGGRRTPLGRRADDGASRLGEIALVDGGGRIGPLGRVFYDTLIDENAASHIALGGGYDHPVEDPAERARINKSTMHVDFMIGEPRARRRRDHARRRRRSGASRRRLADLRERRSYDARASATSSRRSRSSAASSPRSSRRGSAARLSSPNTRSKSGVVR